MTASGAPAIGQRERLPMLDLLRFFAALSVVFYHLTYRPNEPALFTWLQPFTKFGYLGVDVFFIISGFVILWSALGRSVPQYLISRVSRLYPSFWVAILVTSATLLVLRPDRLQPLWAIAVNFTMMPSYFGGPDHYVDSVYWTLAIELKFYFLVLLVLLFRQSAHIERWAWVWLVVTAACYLPQMPHVVQSLSIFPYGAYFIAGSTFYLMWRHGPSPWRAMALCICYLLICLTALHKRPDFIHEVTPDTAWVVVGVVTLGFATFTAIALRLLRELKSRFWLSLGAFTYPVYLVHNEVGKAVFVLEGPATNEWLRAAGALTVVAAITCLMTTYVEQRASPRTRRWLTDLVHKTVRTAKSLAN